MMRFLLGCMLTPVVGVIGAMLGHLIALLLAGFILVIFNNKPTLVWEDLLHAGFHVAPIWTGMLAIAIAWFALLRRPSDFKHASDPRACLTCGYDLKNNTSGTCPECGDRIGSTQQQYLDKYHRNRA